MPFGCPESNVLSIQSTNAQRKLPSGVEIVCNFFPFIVTRREQKLQKKKLQLNKLNFFLIFYINVYELPSDTQISFPHKLCCILRVSFLKYTLVTIAFDTLSFYRILLLPKILVQVPIFLRAV
jgi:hypothetical protein